MVYLWQTDGILKRPGLGQMSRRRPYRHLLQTYPCFRGNETATVGKKAVPQYSRPRLYPIGTTDKRSGPTLTVVDVEHPARVPTPTGPSIIKAIIHCRTHRCTLAAFARGENVPRSENSSARYPPMYMRADGSAHTSSTGCTAIYGSYLETPTGMP